MTPKELNLSLLKAFPELNDAFQKETEWQDGIDTGSTVVFEDIFMPFIVSVVNNRDSQLIDRIFDYIEQLISSNDEYAVNVVGVAIIENILSYEDKDEISKNLRPKSLESFKECL